MTLWQKVLVGSVALPTVIVVGSAVAIISFLYSAVATEEVEW